MKLSSLVRRAAGWLFIILLSGVTGFVYDLHDIQRTFAADGESVTLQATGVNGPITLISSGAGVNTGNPVPIPANGKVSFSLSWNPTGAFTPTTCFAYTQSKAANGNTYNGNLTGSGFMPDTVRNLPTSASNYEVDGTLVPYGNATRVVFLQCDDVPHNQSSWSRFNLIFQAAAGITGDCVPGQGVDLSPNPNGPATQPIFALDGDFSSGSSYAYDQGQGGIICSEGKSDIEPASFCARRCQNYNPARSFLQADGSFALCSNFSQANPLDTGFTTYVTGPKSYTPTVTAGTTFPLNVSFSSFLHGEIDSGIRIGNPNGSYNNVFTKFMDLPEGGWYFSGDQTHYLSDDSNFSAVSDANPFGDLSYRNVSNCRASSVAARTYTDPQSTSNETFTYFQQQYRRDGSRNSNDQNRLWGPELKALYPFVQVEAPRFTVTVSGGVAGVDYTINQTQVDIATLNNAITFLNTGNYTIRLTQEAMTAAWMVCQMPINSGNQPNAQNPPYNCGGNAQRIQQFRGHQFPAMTATYQVKVDPSNGGGNSPTASLTVNGVTADAANPNRITTVSLPAGASQNPVSDSLAASWVATNVPANSCKVDRQDPQNNITVTSNPWKDRQSGLPISNASAPLVLDNIIRGASTDTVFTLICGTGANTVTRTMEVRLSRDGTTPSSALSLTLKDPRTGTAYVADATNPSLTGDVTPFAVTDTAALSAEWQGNTGLLDNSCAVTKMSANPPTVTAQGEPWQSGAVNQPISAGPQTVTLGGLDTPNSNAQIQFILTCKQLDNTNLVRTVNLTVHRGSTPPPPPTTYTISGGATYSNGTNGAIPSNHTMTITGGSANSTSTDSNGKYSFSSLSNGSYTITITPSAGETCVTSCSKAVTITNGDVQNVDFVLQITNGGGNNGSGSGSVLNGGGGSKSF